MSEGQKVVLTADHPKGKGSVSTRSAYLIERLGSYFAVDLRYVLTGGSWLFVGQLATAVSGFLIAVAFAYFLPKETYGTYKYVLALASIISSFSLTGLMTAVVRAVARNFEGVLTVSFWSHLKWSVFMFAAALGVATYYYLQNNYTLALAFLIVGAFSPLIESARLYVAFLRGKKDFKVGTLYNMARSLILTLVLCTTVLLTENLVIIIFVSFFTQTVMSIGFYARTIQKYKPNDRIDKDTLGFSKHISLMNMARAFRGSIDSLLVFNYLGATELAIYAYALIIPQYISGLIKNIGVLAMPKFSQHESSVLKKTLFKKIATTLVFVVPGFLIYVFAAPYIYGVFFPQYLESVPFSQVFAITILLVGTGDLMGTYFDSQMAIKEQYMMVGFTTVAKTTMMAVLVYFYGLWGIIAGWLITHFLGNVLAAVLIKRAA